MTLVVLAATILSACAGDAARGGRTAEQGAVGSVDTTQQSPSGAPGPTERELSAQVAFDAIVGTYDPVVAGEALPAGFRQLLARDDILPVYVPTFVPADQVDWDRGSLVIGVDLEGEARAYPVGFLNRREMVIDDHRGIPTLVTW